MRKSLCAILAFTAIAFGCDEKDCVKEQVTIEITDGDAIALTSRVDVAIVGAEPEHAKLLERARKYREDLECGNDPWSRRLAFLTPATEETIYRKTQQQLVSVERRVEINRPDLARVFSDTQLTFDFFEGPDWTELVISTGRSRAGTARERERVDAALLRLTDAYAEYAAAVADFYEYLEKHPERAREVYRKLAELKDDPDPEDTEIAYFIRIFEKMDAFGKIQMVDETEELSLEAASRKVYDPFPSDLTLKIPTAILESEGFDQRGPQIVEVRRRGLRDSFRSLEGRWVEPDLLAIMIADEEREGTPEPDFVAIGELPRRFARPSGPEVRAALRDVMRPRETYRVRWRRPIAGDPPQKP
ncbi:MAG: hypothetical protein ACYC7A_18135 [Thermoanaerobaculia bacterium]